jgi:SOS response regulatory protein OraA/RecX
MDYTESQAALGKQGRFLMQRGFSGDAVKKVLNGWLPELD